MDYDFILGIEEKLKNKQFYCRTLPNIIKHEGYVELKTPDTSVSIGEPEEIIFSIMLDYTFMPVWLISQILSKNLIEDTREIIMSWINIGIVWSENSIAGEFLRPTYLLYELFGVPLKKFVVIPFNLLTKYINEQNIIYEVMTGKNHLINNRFPDLPPRFSPMGLPSSGTNILFNNQIKNVLHKDPNINDIYEDFKASTRKNISMEFYDYRLFSLFKEDKSKKEGYLFHTPNLIIPQPRYNSSPKSIAIEVELANKRVEYYENIFIKYSNNMVYGSIVFFCTSFTIINNIRNAYMKQQDKLKGMNVYLCQNNIPCPNI